MAFNRYDTISTSTYDPRSLQETLMVPMMRRQQHDEANKQLYTQLGELDKIDPLDVHYNEAQKIKADLTSKINSQAERLATEGFNVNTTSDIYKTNRDVSEQYSPTGKIGKINAAKVDYGKQKEQFLKNAEDQKISRDRALQLWNEKTKDYSGYDAEKNILNITPQGVAAHQDYEDDLMKYHAILGKTTTSAKSSGFKIVDSGQGDGSKVMVDKTGNVVHSDNISQLNNAIKGFGSKWLNPNGEGFKYAKDAGLNITPEKVYGDFSAMTEKSDIDNRGQQNQYIASKENKDGESGGNAKLIENNTLFSPSSLASSPYLDNSKSLKDLQNRKGSLNSEERGKLTELENFQNKVNTDLRSNPEYKSADNKLNSLLNKFSHNVKTILKDPSLRQSFSAVSSDSKGIFNAKGPDGKIIKGGDGKPLQFTSSQMEAIYSNRSKIFDYEKNINKVRDDVTKNNSITEYGYQLVPQTTKDETSIKLATETLENALKSGPKNLLNYANIESVDINGASRTGLDLEDKQKIQEVFNNSERGSFKIISFIPKTAQGKPGYIIEFNTKEGNSSNLNRYFRSEQGSGEIGNGKPVRIKINYDQSKGKVLNTANGYIQEYLSDKGDIDPRTGRKQGYDLAMDMRVNADKSQINNEISKSNIQWKSMVTPTTDFEKLNPFIQKQLQKELIKGYGLNNNTTDAELEKMINSFIKKEGNNTIYVE